MLRINDFPVMPKQYKVVNVKGEQWVAAMMPYPVRQPEDAACAGDRSWIEDLPSGRGAAVQVDYMRATCARCKLLTACQEWGIAHETEWGMWGGLTASERAYIRKGRKQIGFDPSAAHEYGMGDDYWTTGYGAKYAEPADDEWSDDGYDDAPY